MSFMMPKAPQFNPNMLAGLRPPPPPAFGQDVPGAALRKQGEDARKAAFSGSLMGSQLQTANVGGKTLLGQAGG
jgi:hypothetical protein